MRQTYIFLSLDQVSAIAEGGRSGYL